MKPGAWHGEIPVEFLYTAGVAGERFFTELRDYGRLMGTRCPSCNVVYLPARMFCERCFAGLNEWVDVEPRGRIYSHTVLRQDRKGNLLEKPLVIAFVKFNGVRGGLIHRLEGVAPEEVRPGLEVEALIKGPGERKGTILDIIGFRGVP